MTKKQHYKESIKILKKIKSAKNILLNCHRYPDPDSIGSALSLYEVMRDMGKDVAIVCPTRDSYDEISFLANYSVIEYGIDITKHDFSKYDLFVVLDSGSWNMVTDSVNTFETDIPVVVIDHHYTNSGYGEINLLDTKSSSVGEILYFVYKDWQVEISHSIATALLTAIIGDTGNLKYPNTTEKTFEAFYNLIKLGADKNKIISEMYRNHEFDLLKFAGRVLERMVFEEKYGFVYSFACYEDFEKYGKPKNAKDFVCDLFAQSTKGADFGVMGLETEKGLLKLSFRSRDKFDVSEIALDFGGGGHKAASGATIRGVPFDKAVEKVLKVCREYAKRYLEKNKNKISAT